MVSKVDRIDGSATFLVIHGDPIAQVRFPIAFNARLRARGCNQRMIPWHAPLHAFNQFIPGLTTARNHDGIVITYPFQARVLAFATSVSRHAVEVGAASALRREADGRRVGRSTRSSRRRIRPPTRSVPIAIRPERARD